MSVRKENLKKVQKVADDLEHLIELIRPHDFVAAQDLERARRELLFSDSHLAHELGRLESDE